MGHLVRAVPQGDAVPGQAQGGLWPDREKARAFIAANAPLPFYEDEALAMPYDIKPPVEGFPTTFLYDAQGREVARIPQDHDWSGPDARKVVDALLKGS
jgi:hypothetical protein